MTLKRKSMVLVLLVGVLSLSVYLSGSYNDPALEVTTAVETGKNLGQAALVNGTVTGDAAKTDDVETLKQADGYFDKAKLTREQTRDEAIELLKSVANNEASDENTIQMSLNKISQIAQHIEVEGKIENLVRAKGFTQCLVYMSDDSVNVMVDADGLDDAKAAKIKDIVISETELTGEAIKLVEVKN